MTTGSAAPHDSDWQGVRLHIVTGKGGTGKTTVAAALALALANQGKRVLLVEVEGRQAISQTFDVTPLAHTEARISHAEHGGKVYEAVRRRRDPKTKGPRAAPAYDAVVLDAPPTGRVVRFLNVNHEVAGVAKVGPIRSQADSITAMMQSPQTVVHVVTLLEEMPVQETVDAIGDLRAAGFGIGGVVVNQVREPLLPAEALAAAGRTQIDDALVAADLEAVGMRAGDALVRGLLTQAR